MSVGAETLFRPDGGDVVVRYGRDFRTARLLTSRMLAEQREFQERPRQAMLAEARELLSVVS